MWVFERLRDLEIDFVGFQSRSGVSTEARLLLLKFYFGATVNEVNCLH